MAPMVHPRHQPALVIGRGIYLGVEGAGNNMSDTGELILYKIICWKIISMEIKGGARAP